MAEGVKFFQLPPETVPTLWHLLRPRIMSVVERSSGRITEETVCSVLCLGQWQCWTAWDGDKLIAVVVTRLRPDPSGIKVLEAIGASGDDRGKWQRLAADELEKFARIEECTIFEMWARPGWERVFPDFKKTHVLLEKRL